MWICISGKAPCWFAGAQWRSWQLMSQCNDTASNLQQLLGMASMIGTQMAPVFATGATNASAICLANQNVCDPGNSQPG